MREEKDEYIYVPLQGYVKKYPDYHVKVPKPVRYILALWVFCLGLKFIWPDGIMNGSPWF